MYSWTRFLVAPSIILPVRRVWLAGWLADTLLLQAIPLSKQVFLDPVSATKNKTPLPTESKIQDIDNVSTDIMSCKAVQMVPQTKQSGKRKDKELHPKVTKVPLSGVSIRILVPAHHTLLFST